MDVGCRDRPYEQLFAGRAARYVGVDVVEGEKVDVVAPADALPFSDEQFDCLLSTQTLQYVPRPLDALEEFRRVLKPNGTLFLSTHGVGFTDRAIRDYWRWTEHGLRSLFQQTSGWGDVEVLPAGGVLCAAAYLIGGQLEFAAHRLRVPPAAAPFCLALNVAGWRADAATRRLYPALPPAASVNFLAVASRG